MNNDTINKGMDWRTPPEVFDPLNTEFHFTLDAAATESSAKCAKYYTPETDGLSASWEGETVFCHPPAAELADWVRKCAEEGRKPGTTVVLFAPAKTDAAYFHDHILGQCELRFLKGRIVLMDENSNSSGRPACGSLLAIYRGAAEAGNAKELVLEILKEQPMTANEITDRLHAAGHNVDRGTVSPSLTKLKAAGKVMTAEKRPCSKTGKLAVVWALCEEVAP
jgi:site-specific DNA-methyltransferase (adenine-specific)